MSQATKRKVEEAEAPVRVLGRGLGAQRGVRLTLRGIREAAGKTQVEVKDASKIDQGDISRLETRGDFDDCQVATLQRYAKALGYTVELRLVKERRLTTRSSGRNTRGTSRPGRRPT